MPARARLRAIIGRRHAELPALGLAVKRLAQVFEQVVRLP